MILVDINDKYKKDYKKLNKDLVNQYIKQIEIFFGKELLKKQIMKLK